MQAGEYKLLIQLDMEELFSGKTVTTFRYIKPKGDINCTIKTMNRHQHRDTVQYSCPARKKTHHMYDYESTTGRKPI